MKVIPPGNISLIREIVLCFRGVPYTNKIIPFLNYYLQPNYVYYHTYHVNDLESLLKSLTKNKLKDMYSSFVILNQKKYWDTNA